MKKNVLEINAREVKDLGSSYLVISIYDKSQHKDL
jgi:hypothetical protein